MSIHAFRKLDLKLKRLDHRRTVFLDALATLTETQLKEKPHPDRWSLLQVAEHLMLGERDVLQQLPDPSRLIARRRTFRDRRRFWLVMAVLRFDIRVNISSSAMIPDGNMTLDEIRQKWDESHTWLRRFLGTLNHHSVGRAVFVHPVAGPLTLSQALTLDLYHFDSHLRKINASMIRNGIRSEMGINPA